MSTSSETKLADRLLRQTGLRPTLGIVLGSGFQGVADCARVEAEVPYSSLPGFPPARVDGHAGKVLFGRLGSAPVVMLCGRSHYYEGRSLDAVTLSIRTLFAMGVTDLLLTNAAGGINPDYNPGDFMAFSDHINFMGVNPLRGALRKGLNSFVDLTQAYDPGLRGLLGRAAEQHSLRLHSGVYIAVSGPSYETPAEIRAFARLGSDAVGMSTVPEVIVARRHGMKVAALSCVTNKAAGLHPVPLSHEDVLAVAESAKSASQRLVTAFADFHEAAKQRLPTG